MFFLQDWFGDFKFSIFETWNKMGQIGVVEFMFSFWKWRLFRFVNFFRFFDLNLHRTFVFLHPVQHSSNNFQNSLSFMSFVHLMNLIGIFRFQFNFDFSFGGFGLWDWWFLPHTHSYLSFIKNYWNSYDSKFHAIFIIENQLANLYRIAYERS